MKTALSKVTFEISGLNDPGFEIERLWAVHDDGNIYIIDNSPFQIFGVSVGDKIATTKKNGELTFANVVERGGHSTYRVKLSSGCDHNYFLQHWDELDRLGCTYEGAVSGENRLYSIDIPNPMLVAEAYRILQKYEDAKVWEFEEAHCFLPDQNQQFRKS